jgi:hypothetical protein
MSGSSLRKPHGSRRDRDCCIDRDDMPSGLLASVDAVVAWPANRSIGSRSAAARSRSTRPGRSASIIEVSPRPGPPPWCGAGMPIRSASCAHGTRCLRSSGARHPPYPARPAPAWSPSSWGSVERPFVSASCRVIDCRACTPTWFGAERAIQITTQDFRVQKACAPVSGVATPSTAISTSSASPTSSAPTAQAAVSLASDGVR